MLNNSSLFLKNYGLSLNYVRISKRSPVGLNNFKLEINKKEIAKNSLAKILLFLDKNITRKDYSNLYNIFANSFLNKIPSLKSLNLYKNEIDSMFKFKYINEGFYISIIEKLKYFHREKEKISDLTLKISSFSFNYNTIIVNCVYFSKIKKNYLT